MYKTSNGSQGAGFLQRANFRNNRFKAKLALSAVRLNYDFFGIGDDAGDRGIATPDSWDPVPSMILRAGPPAEPRACESSPAEGENRAQESGTGE